jgi:hypothetical protein
MNKRSLKKRDKKLYRAVKELNEMVAKDLGFLVNEPGIISTYEKIRKNPRSAKRTIRDHKKYVLQAK